MSELPENVKQEVQEVLDELSAAEKKAKTSYYELANFLYALEHCRKKIREIREAALHREMMKNTPDLPGV
jgi:ABC-type Zn uptake system ZnuABC Zn-binding protein ZnuA